MDKILDIQALVSASHLAQYGKGKGTWYGRAV